MVCVGGVRRCLIGVGGYEIGGLVVKLGGRKDERGV